MHKITFKNKCSICGTEGSLQSVDHYGETESVRTYNKCAKCGRAIRYRVNIEVVEKGCSPDAIDCKQCKHIDFCMFYNRGDGFPLKCPYFYEEEQ